MARSKSPVPRSRSPPHNPKPKSKSKSGGFRWKDKPRRDEVDTAEADDSGLQRGYRERDEKRRERSRSRDRQHRNRQETEDERKARKERKRGREREQEDNGKSGKIGEGGGSDDGVTAEASVPTVASIDRTIDDDITAKFGPGASAVSSSKPTTSTVINVPLQRPAAKAPPPNRGFAGPMIVVKINDRLGTTTRVPCLASDTVGDFKKMVAMRIGRKPHEIMLKRQSERPFKDFLTLEDYGVSDGVQLDLELDTGD